MASYPIFYGPYGPPADPWASLNADRRAQSAGSVPRMPTTRATFSPTPAPATVSAEQWAQEQASRYIQSLIDSINAQKQMYLDELRAESELENQRGAELAQALEGLNIPGRVQQIYGDASSDIGGLAQAFSGSLRGQAEADAASQTRMLAGTGQEGAVRNQGENLGNVLYGLGGYIPARSMSETGAAFASQAALEPGFARRIGAQKAGDVYSEGLKGLSQFTEALTEAESQRPQLEMELMEGRRSILDDARDYKLKSQTQSYNRLKSERDFLVKQSYLALAQGDRKRSNEYLKLAKQKEDRMVAADQGYDTEGNLLPEYTLGKDGNPIKRSDLAKANKPKVDAQKAKAKAQTTSRKDREEEFRKARLDAIDEAKRLVIPAKGYTQPEKRPSYQVAYQKLWNRYKDLLRFGTPGGQKKLRARIDKLIREALLSNGWTAPVKSTAGSREPGNRDYPGA